MTKRLSQDEMGRVAEKVMEWGNLVFAGLVLTQFLSEKANILVIAVGFAGIIGAYGGAIFLMKGGTKK